MVAQKRFSALIAVAVEQGFVSRADVPRIEREFDALSAKQPGVGFEDWFAGWASRRPTVPADALVHIRRAFEAQVFRCRSCGTQSTGQHFGQRPILVCPACRSTELRRQRADWAAETTSASGTHPTHPSTDTGTSSIVAASESAAMTAPVANISAAPTVASTAVAADDAIAGCRVLGPLGSTAIGAVFSASRLTSHAPAQVVVATPDTLAERPELPAVWQRLAQFSHPAVESVLAVETDHHGRVVVAFERPETTGTLADHLARHGRFHPREAAAVTTQIATALAALHAVGISHGNVHPGSIRILRGRRANQPAPVVGHSGTETTAAGLTLQVADVGSAVKTRCAKDVNRSGFVLGEPAFLAPEIIQEKSPSAAADIYALGATLFALMAGHPPFSGRPDDVLMKQVAEPLPAVPTYPDGALGADEMGQATALAALIRRMTAKRPADRPQTMSDVVAALAGTKTTAAHTAAAHTMAAAAAGALESGVETELVALPDTVAAETRTSSSVEWDRPGIVPGIAGASATVPGTFKAPAVIAAASPNGASLFASWAGLAPGRWPKKVAVGAAVTVVALVMVGIGIALAQPWGAFSADSPLPSASPSDSAPIAAAGDPAVPSSPMLENDPPPSADTPGDSPGDSSATPGDTPGETPPPPDMVERPDIPSDPSTGNGTGTGASETPGETPGTLEPPAMTELPTETPSDETPSDANDPPTEPPMPPPDTVEPPPMSPVEWARQQIFAETGDRSAAFEWLREHFPSTPAARTVLHDALADHAESAVRAEAAVILGTDDDPLTLERLIDAGQGDPDAEVLRAVFFALGELSTRQVPLESLQILARMVRQALQAHPDAEVRYEAATLGQIIFAPLLRIDRSTAHEIAGLALGDTEIDTKKHGLSMAVMARDAEFLPTLATLYQAADPESDFARAVRRVILHFAATLDVPADVRAEIVAVVATALAGPDGEVRVVALGVAEKWKMPEFRDALRSALAVETDAAVLARIRELLKILDPSVGEVLRETLANASRAFNRGDAIVAQVARRRLLQIIAQQSRMSLRDVETAIDDRLDFGVMQQLAETTSARSRVGLGDAAQAAISADNIIKALRQTDEILAVTGDSRAHGRLLKWVQQAPWRTAIKSDLEFLVELFSEFPATAKRAATLDALRQLLVSVEEIFSDTPDHKKILGWPQPGTWAPPSDPGLPLALLSNDPSRWPAADLSRIRPHSTGTGRLTIAGTPAAMAAAERLFEGFRRTYPGITIFQVPGTHSVAEVQEMLAAGHCDVALLTGPLPVAWPGPERPQWRSAQFIPIGHVGVILATHHDNLVPGLSIDQARELFTGRRENWSAFGGRGPNAPLRLIAPRVGSCVTDYFQARVMRDTPMGRWLAVDGATAEPIEARIRDELRQLPGGLAVASLFFGSTDATREGIRLLRINDVPPTVENIRHGRYPLASELVVARPGEFRREHPAGQFEAFALSDLGQRLLRDGGAFPRYPVVETADRNWRKLFPTGTTDSERQNDQKRPQIDSSRSPLSISVNHDTYAIAYNLGLALQTIDRAFHMRIMLPHAPLGPGFLRLSPDMPPVEPGDEVPWQGQVIAFESVAVIVSKHHPWIGVDRETLRKIYTGEATEWASFGARAVPVGDVQPPARLSRIRALVHTPVDGIGDSDKLFAHAVLRGRGFAGGEFVRGASTVMALVASDPNAIAFVPLSELSNRENPFREQVKVIRVDGIECTPETVRAGTYPLARPIYAFCRGPIRPGSPARRYIDFLTSDLGQTIIQRIGGVRLRSPSTFSPIFLDREQLLMISESDWLTLTASTAEHLRQMCDEVPHGLESRVVIRQIPERLKFLEPHLKPGDIIAQLDHSSIRNVTDLVNGLKAESPDGLTVFLETEDNRRRRIYIQFR